MTGELELNSGICFQTLDEDLRKTFSPRMAPMALRFERGDEVYKWTQFPLITVDRETQNERITPFWNCWKELKIGDVVIPGFKQLRTRYRNVEGSAGRPQEFARTRSSVTMQWNEMHSILRARFLHPVWGVVGRARYQRLWNDPDHPRELDNVFAMGGDFQVCCPNLTRDWIEKL